MQGTFTLNNRLIIEEIDMNKFIRQLSAIVLITLSILIMVAGCSRDSDSRNPEFIYVSESILIPQELGGISNLNYFDNKVYFTSNLQIYNDDHTITFSSAIYSINTDGTGLALLPEYKSPTALLPDALGGVIIDVMHIDRNGSIWVAERWTYSQLAVLWEVMVMKAIQ